jgi:hypothetical protein
LNNLNSSETDLKQIISLNKELTTTTPIVEKSEQETGEAIENGNLTPLSTDIPNISIQMKNINDRFDLPLVNDFDGHIDVVIVF